MRRASLFLLAPLVGMACFSSSNPPPDSGNPDASIEDSPEDSPAEASPLPEAATPEASVEASAEAAVDALAPDAAPVDAPAETADVAAVDVVDAGLPVTVMVQTIAGPEPGIKVVFDDAQGNYLSMATTDATGSAAQVVPAGALVTVLLGQPPNVSLWTVAGVQPGDTLATFDASALTTVQATVAGVPAALPSQYTYSTYTGACQTNSIGIGVPLPANGMTLAPLSCYASQNAPALFESQTSTWQELGYAFEKSASIDFESGPSASLSSSGSWLTDEGSMPVTFSNAPAGFSVAFGEAATGVVTWSQSTRPTVDADGGAATPFTTHPQFSDFIQTEADLEGGPCGFATSAMVTRAANATANVSMDLSQLMPIVLGSSADGSDSARPVATWTTSAPLTSATAVLSQVTWSASIDGGTQTGTWTMLVPASAPSATAPALPASLGAWVPAPGAGFGPSPVVVGLGGTYGYATLRQSVGATFPVSFPMPAANGTGTAGEITPTLWAPGVLLYTWGPDTNGC